VDPASSGVTRVVAVKPAEIVVSLAPALSRPATTGLWWMGCEGIAGDARVARYCHAPTTQFSDHRRWWRDVGPRLLCRELAVAFLG
jgi:hypothetical protein